MARHARRLIVWTTGVLLALALLALLCIALLVWGIDPDVFRGRLERAASDALGRRVELTGPLRWRPGLNFQIESRDGRIHNLQGFGPAPLASWQSLRLGVALRPLLDRHLVVDHIELQGLRLDLARGPRGVNWALPASSAEEAASGTADTGFSLAVGSIRLREGAVQFRDDPGGLWSLTQLAVDVSLPARLDAPALLFTNVAVQARLSGPTLEAGGVALQWSAPHVEFEPSAPRIALPQWRLAWNDASATGAINATFGAKPAAEGSLRLEAPSLRRLLQTVSIILPATQDAAVFGPLRLAAQFAANGDSARVTQIDASLDATRVTGEVSVPALVPPALRFTLAADQLDADRYLSPESEPSTPLELPLAALRTLDAKGSLEIRRATLAGAAAREMRIDVD